ncbi:YjbH domain-containing protein [Parabacteroides goldsteinii]|uniref:YjbH domain-containing protein n=1 Tax=Parabacteroides goldsteinii TaxID=328812 RepID=UPI001FBA24A9|nr:YjbH domain-containing protein [Parabacteroides goldsteinii]
MRRRCLGMVCLMAWGMVAVLMGQQPAGRSVAEAAEQTLLSLGMEEIRVAQTDSVCTIAFEDNIYRGTYRGLAAVIEALRSLPETEQAAAYELVVLDDRIPRLLLTLPRQTVALEVSYDTDEAMRRLKGKERRNKMAGRIDVVLYPELFLQNSWLDKLYGVAVNISPAIQMDLWKGAVLTGQVVLPVYTNMTDFRKYIRPGVITLRQEFRLPGGVSGRLTAGNFTGNRMGVDAGLRYQPARGRWLVGANVGLTGSSTCYGGEWVVSTWRRVSGSVWGRYNEPHYGLQIDLAAVRLVYGDMGARLDCRRHFGEVTVGVYGLFTDGEMNGGFHFALPIPGTKRGKRRAVRFRLPEYFAHEYRARHGGSYGDELLGYSYEVRPDENGSRGYDAPDFVKKEILRIVTK